MSSRSKILYIFAAVLVTFTAEFTFAHSPAVRIARAARAADCNTIIAADSSADLNSKLADDVRYVEQNQVDIYLDFRHKVAARKAAGFADPLNVSMPIFKNSLAYIQAELRAAAHDLSRKRFFRRKPDESKIKLRNFVENLIREGDAIEQAGLPYQRFVNYAFLFTIARTHALGVDLSSDTITLSEYKVETANSYLEEHKDVVFIPPGALYFPMPHPLDIDDFIALRATPIFFIGVASNEVSTDGFILNPAAFFRHDLSHSGLMLLRDNDSRSVKIKGDFFALPDSFFKEKYEKYKAFCDKVQQIQNPLLRRAVKIVLFEYLHERGISADDSNVLRGIEISDLQVVVDNRVVVGNLREDFYGDPRQLGRDPLKMIEQARAWVEQKVPQK